MLIVEDNPDDADLLVRELRRAGFDPEWSRVETEPDFLAALQNPPEIILSDYSMPHFSGLRALELLRASGRDIPFILISGTVGEDVAVQSMRDGATDYLLKDRPVRLASAVTRALAETQLRAGRHQAEAAQARLAAIVTSSDDAIIGKTLEGTITSWNAGAERVFGYTAAEAVGQSMLMLFPPDRVDEEPDMLARVARGDSVRHFETVRVRKDGERIEVSVTLSPLIDHDGHIVGASKIARDITERKRAEEELLQRAQLSALGAAVGLALANSDTLSHALERCAEALVKHLGAAISRIWTFNERDGVLELQASAGLYTHEKSPYGKAPVGQIKIGRIARDRKPYLTNSVIGDSEVSDHEWARREGMVAFAGHPLVVDGRVVGVMAIFAQHALSDSVISALASVADHIALGIERHRGAEALRIIEARTRFALQSADVGIWDMDYRTGVLHWSETIEAHYGLKPGTFGGTFGEFIQLIHPDDRASVLETVGKAMKAGTDFSVSHRALWHDGTVRWIGGAGCVLLDASGEPLRALGISIDVTERRTLEQQFQQAQKMEAVGQLAGGVAHDFNNLLTAILGFSNFVMDSFEADDARRGDLEQVIKAGQRASALTKQLLAFSRKQVLQPIIVDLNALVTGVHKMLARLIGEQIELVMVLGANLRVVRADPGQLEQIVTNLVVNARDAMPHGGRVAIETANIQLDELFAMQHHTVRPGPYVMLAVTDGGIGMTEEVKRRLFEPFFSTKEPGKGTGLGLATVYGIVQQSGGDIWVYSEPGVGTTFKIYFPVAEREPEALSPDDDEAAAPRGSETVLLVEDEEAVRFLSRVILEKAGYRVVDAPNPKEAEALFVENPRRFDLLVTDVIMPGSSGPKLFERLVQVRPDLKVLYVSGYTDDEIVHCGQLDPGVEFLQKPFTAAELSRRVRAVIDR
jgi:PAS domain S-box-containing protein